MSPIIPLEDIMARRTPKGGWTRADIARWGVPWPPPRGWKAVLTGNAPTEDWLALSSAEYRLAAAIEALKAIEATTACMKARNIAREAIAKTTVKYK
jgi:hypothetical protein